MPGTVRVEFDIPLSVHGDAIRVRIVRDGKIVVDFVAQYEAFIDGVHRPVLRYDASHGRPHCDILGWRGETVEKVWLPKGTSHNDALRFAITDIRHNWERYRAGFLRRQP